MNDKLLSLHFTTGRAGIKCPSNSVRHKDSTDVVTKEKKIAFLSEIKLVLSTPQPVTQITMVCRTAISVTLHDFYNDVVYKLQEVREEQI